MSEVENVNTNTTQTTETLERSGSSSEPVSFDDLESIVDTKPRKELAKDPEKIEGKVKVDDGDPKKAKQDAPQKKDIKQDKAADLEADKTGGDKPKTLKLKNGDADLEVPVDAKITVKVNGKDEQFTVQELVNEFSGKTDYGRKYQELDTEKKKFNHERDTINTNISELHRLVVTDGKPLDGLALLTDLLGGDGDKLVKEARKKIYESFEAYSKLTPEERQQAELLEDNAALQAKLQRRDALDQNKQKTTEFENRVKDVKTKHNLDDARYEEIREQLKASVEEADLTPELVGAVSENWKRMDQVDEVVEQALGLEKGSEAGNAAFKELMAEWNKDPSLTKAQIQRIATEVFGKKKASKLTDKINRSGASTKTPTPKSKQTEATFFDDID